MAFGNLYLIPCPIGSMQDGFALNNGIIQQLDYFVAERAKTARQFLKTCDLKKPLQQIQVEELQKHEQNDFKLLLKPCLEGHDMGIVSEAGCPGVADPGAGLVDMAHRMGVKVIPLVGPSSILLALMGSGLNGQTFIFHGYLTIDKNKLKQALRKTEQHSAQQNCTQIAIETPYRNMQFVRTALDAMHPNTQFTIACNLNTTEEFIKTKRIKDWKQSEIPDLHKKPTVFCWLLNK